MSDTIYLQDLFANPVVLTAYETVLLRKVQKNQAISKREIAFLLSKNLLIEQNGQYFFAKGVDTLLKRTLDGSSLSKKRRIKNRDRQK